MRITDLLTEDGILIGAAATTKEEAITMLVSGPERFGCVTDPAVCRADVLARESWAPPPCPTAWPCPTPRAAA